MAKSSRLLFPISALLLAGLGLLGPGGCRPAPVPGPGRDPGSPGSVVLPTLEGGTYRLGDGRDDVLVVTFFATWCMPCIAEVPYLRTLHHRPGVRVVGISVDEGGEKVLRPFRDHFEIDYPILLADEEMTLGRSPFGHIPGIPATFVLDRRREVHAAILGGIAPSTFDPILAEAAGKK
ncbi:MAG: TlpA disulfide reductase family protein [Deltaproteobacteria bacterium]|nr:TlpA disulfide reductase family protein [Deltaproteobacteria bacterium]